MIDALHHEATMWMDRFALTLNGSQDLPGLLAKAMATPIARKHEAASKGATSPRANVSTSTFPNSPDKIDNNNLLGNYPIA